MIRIDDKKLEKKIIKLYNENISTAQIAIDIDMSETYVIRVLVDLGEYVFKDGTKIKTKREFNPAIGNKFIVVCKKTGKEFDDFQNKSGSLTRHLIFIFPDIIINSEYLNRNYYLKTNKFWYEEYFDIKEVRDELYHKPKKKCNYCYWETIDIENKSGWYGIHLEKKHNLNLATHLLNFPEDKSYFKKHVEITEETNRLLLTPDNYVECVICGEKMRRITNTHLENKHNITLLGYILKYSADTISQYSLGVCKERYEKNLKNKGYSFTSKAETEVSEFIQSLGYQVKNNNRKVLRGAEMDVFLPEINFGIEYNGLYYHTEGRGKADPSFHFNRSLLAESFGVRLVHVFEDDWSNREDVVKSMLKNILQEYNISPNESQYVVHPIGALEKSKFLSEYNINGDDKSDMFLAAFCEQNTVPQTVITFKFDNLNKHASIISMAHSYENNINPLPIFKKIIDRFIAWYGPTKIIAYSDRCWNFSKDEIYSMMGFKCVEIIPPDYAYFNSGIIRLERLKKTDFSKKTLKAMFPENYSNHLTEWEIMKSVGSDRIWDCGKLKYELSLA